MTYKPWPKRNPIKNCFLVPNEIFQLKLVTAERTEVYHSCRWTNTSREFTREGLRRIRDGFAMDKEAV